MFMAFKVLVIFFLFSFGIGTIADNKNQKGYLMAYSVSGILFILAMVIDVLK